MNTSEHKRNMEKFAEVILKVGLNFQPGQRLLIGYLSFSDYFGVQVEIAPLVRLIADKAYQYGAKYVEVLWSDPPIRLSRFRHAPKDSFCEFPDWRVNECIEYIKAGDALLMIDSENLNLLDNQDPSSVSAFHESCEEHTKERFYHFFHEKQHTGLCTVAAGTDWAKEVLPDLSTEESVIKLWDVIFDICHIKCPDPVTGWKTHIRNLERRCSYLNEKSYSALKFTSPGTDLVIHLADKHIWNTAKKTNGKGIDYLLNIPTEEIFSLPQRDSVSGFVTSTKPFYIRGKKIEEMKLNFSNGKVVNASAKNGEKVLRKFIESDESVCYLGEVALVPHSSPISKSGLIFNHPIIDENAACHLALGRGYRNCIKGGTDMSAEEFVAAGGNDSQHHTDFMIGSGEINVDGIKEDGTSESIMKAGEWVFNI